MQHILVEDSYTFRHLSDIGSAVVWTQSSGLPYVSVLRGKTIRSLEEAVDRQELEQMWRSLLDARPRLDAALSEAEADDRFSHLAHSCARSIYSSAVQIATKAFLLDRWLAARKGESVAIAGSPKLAEVHQLRVTGGQYDHLFAALASEWRGGESPELMQTPPVARDLFQKSFAHVPFADRLFNSLNRPRSSLRFKAWKARRKPIGTGDRGVLLILRENELIEESFSRLVEDGWRLVDEPVSRLVLDDVATDDRPDSVDRNLDGIWRTAVAPHLTAAAGEAGLALFKRRFRAMVESYPTILAAVRQRVADWKLRYAKDGLPFATLSTGLYAPLHRLHDACLRDIGATVVCTDHGSGIGLLKRLDPIVDDYIGFSDLYLTYNDEIRDLFRESTAGTGLAVETVGSPTEISRARFPSLQRAVFERMTGLHGTEPTLMYVTGIGQNNFAQGYRMGTDRDYAIFQRRLVDCLPVFAGRPTIKPYPAHRFADPEQIWSMDLPAGVQRMPFGEFRHSRWIADVLLLDTHSSTISWALGCDKPLIYVDNPADPLTDRGREALRHGVFYVDGRDPDWPDTLQAILRTGLSDLIRKWRAMAPARAEFSRRYAIGPDGDPAQAVMQALRRLSDDRPPRRMRQTVRKRTASGSLEQAAAV